MSHYSEMLQRDVKDHTAATYYTVGVIEAIVESDITGEEKIERVRQALFALEGFESA